jgi:hypothetical protein
MGLCQQGLASGEQRRHYCKWVLAGAYNEKYYSKNYVTCFLLARGRIITINFPMPVDHLLRAAGKVASASDQYIKFDMSPQLMIDFPAFKTESWFGCIWLIKTCRMFTSVHPM